jgi:hypothetical protein
MPFARHNVQTIDEAVPAMALNSYKVENVYTAAQQPPVAAKRKHTLPKLKMDVL